MKNLTWYTDMLFRLSLKKIMVCLYHWGGNELSQSSNGKEQIPSSHTLVNTSTIHKQAEKVVGTLTCTSIFYVFFSESGPLLRERILHSKVYPCSDSSDSRSKPRLDFLILLRIHFCGVQTNTSLNAHFRNATASVSLTDRLSLENLSILPLP